MPAVFRFLSKPATTTVTVAKTAISKVKQIVTPTAKRTANPFKGKNPKQVEKMFQKKGFTKKGPDPASGRGTYVNPKTGRGYHINANHPPPKPPHIGAKVNGKGEWGQTFDSLTVRGVCKKRSTA